MGVADHVEACSQRLSATPERRPRGRRPSPASGEGVCHVKPLADLFRDLGGRADEREAGGSTSRNALP